MTDAPIRFALPLIGRGGWTGGYVYLKNTLRLIRSRLDGRIEPSVFLSPSEFQRYGGELSPLVDGRLIVDPLIARAGRGGSLVRALATGRDHDLERLLKASKVNVALEVASFYGARFELPTVAWMADFQHRHMAEMFGQFNWWRRDLGFRAQIRFGRTLMLSSATARGDMENSYPASRGRGHVVRFAIELDIPSCMERAAQIRKKYNLPERFFFLPNQFWKHKNHPIVVSALTILKEGGKLGNLPPVILSGLKVDPRNPGYFDSLMTQAQQAGVQDHFRYLGLIPYEDVLALAGACDTLINPSRFEGWSTPIEEAKALGAPLLLSDIPIHREQAPHAHFFDPSSAHSAAHALLEISARAPQTRLSSEEMINNQNRRLEDHAASLLGTVQAAMQQR